jgi:hypothetical protein
VPNYCVGAAWENFLRGAAGTECENLEFLHVWAEMFVSLAGLGDSGASLIVEIVFIDVLPALHKAQYSRGKGTGEELALLRRLQQIMPSLPALQLRHVRLLLGGPTAQQTLGRADGRWDPLSLLFLLALGWLPSGGGGPALPLSQWVSDTNLIQQADRLARSALRERSKAAAATIGGSMGERDKNGAGGEDGSIVSSLYCNMSFTEFSSIIGNIGVGGENGYSYSLLPFLPMPLSPLCLSMSMTTAGQLHMASRLIWSALGRPENMFSEVAAVRLLRTEALALSQRHTQTGIMLLVVQEEMEGSQEGRKGMWGWDSDRMKSLGQLALLALQHI